MRNKSAGSVPVLPEVTKYPFAQKLSGKDLREYEARCSLDIARDQEGFVRYFRSIPGFEGVPAESLEHAARFAAIWMTNSYNDGLQYGLEQTGANNRAALERAQSFMQKVVGN